MKSHFVEMPLQIPIVVVTTIILIIIKTFYFEFTFIKECYRSYVYYSGVNLIAA